MVPSIRTARVTGLLYLGLAVTGGLGFLLVRPQLYVVGDAAATYANLVEQPDLARAGIALELLVVGTQALTTAWFYRLFRAVTPAAAAGVAAFGLANAVIILGSAALLATAVDLSRDPVGDAAAATQLLYLVSGNLWAVGAVFFGLWLVPMGFCVLSSGWLPRALGWVLVVGGVGYVLSAFVGLLVPGARVLADVLTVPATVGEFWILGYLIIFGVRDRTPRPTPTFTSATPASP